MKADEIQDLIHTFISGLGHSSTHVLTQVELTELTDGVAQILDTVNPNGPHYPSTPR